MKPIKLILSAFGPYKDQAEIDFEKIKKLLGGFNFFK